MAHQLYDFQEQLVDYFVKKDFDYQQSKEYVDKLEKQIGKTTILESNYYYLCMRKRKLNKILNNLKVKQ